MTKPSKNEVATPDTAAVSTLPDYLQGSAAMGNENVTRQDVTIPRIGMIQSLSPEREKGNAKRIEGCEEGQFFNTVTRELLAETFNFVDVFYTKTWGVFTKRVHGGGFRGQFKTEQEAALFVAQQENGNQMEVVETAVHVIVRLDESDRPVETAILMFTVSKLKVSRDMNTILKGTGAARFATKWQMASIAEKSTKGPYYNFKTTKLGFVSPELFAYAKGVYEEVKDKDLSASAAAANAADSASPGSADGADAVEY